MPTTAITKPFAITALIGSTTVVELSQLLDTVTLQYPQAATVDLDLFDPITGAPVAGATDIALVRDVTTSGAATIYRGVIPHTAALVAGVYPARVTITDGTNVRVMKGTCTARDG